MRDMILKCLKEQVEPTLNPKLVGRLIKYIAQRPKMTKDEAQRVLTNFGVPETNTFDLSGHYIANALGRYSQSFNAMPTHFYVVELTKANQVWSGSGYVEYDTNLYYILSDQAIPDLKGRDWCTITDDMKIWFQFIFDVRSEEDDNKTARQKFGLRKKIYEGQILECKVRFECVI